MSDHDINNKTPSVWRQGDTFFEPEYIEELLQKDTESCVVSP